MEIIRLKKQREKKRKLVDKQTAFIEYKAEGGGHHYEEQIISNRVELKQRK